jgi:hypothetical protein
MIIAAITALVVLLGGGIFTFDSVRDAAEEVIKDKDRAKQVAAITEQADAEIKSFTENLEKLSEQFVEMNRNYDLTRAEIDAVSLQAKKNRTAFLKKYVELRFQMKELVTADEWQAMQVAKKE